MTAKQTPIKIFGLLALCAAIDYPQFPVVVWMDDKGYHLDLVSHADVSLFRRWHETRKPGVAAPRFAEADRYISTAAFTQGFLLRCDGKVLFRIDISRADMKEEFAGSSVSENDYSIDLTIAPGLRVTQAVMIQGLRGCITYFLSFNEVHQLVYQADLQDTVLRLFAATGFRLLEDSPNGKLYGRSRLR